MQTKILRLQEEQALLQKYVGDTPPPPPAPLGDVPL